MKLHHIIGGFIGAWAIVALLSGCTNPSPYVFTPQEREVTNWVSTVTNHVNQTNWVTTYRTNVIELPPLPGQPPQFQINIMPVNNAEVTTLVEYRHTTNSIVEISYAPSTNALSLAQDAGALSNLLAPGTGAVVATGVTAFLGLLATLFTRKQTRKQVEGEMLEIIEDKQEIASNAAKALAFTIENYRDVILKLPNGEAIDAKLMQVAQRKQNEADVAKLVLDVLNRYINNPDVQLASKAISDELDSLLKTP